MTALGVAAPLAIEATRADEVRFATPSEDEPETTPTGDTDDGPTLIETDGDAKGGIGSRAPVKAQAQTSKSETSGASTPTTAGGSGTGPALTNPSSTLVEDFEDPLAPTVSTTLAEPPTTTTLPVTITPTTEAETTTSSSSTTSTTASTTTSSSSSSTTDGALTGTGG
ncbi:MAG: hypothetical protein AAGA59_19465 [Actinomycetota bacterium]